MFTHITYAQIFHDIRSVSYAYLSWPGVAKHEDEFSYSRIKYVTTLILVNISHKSTITFGTERYGLVCSFLKTNPRTLVKFGNNCHYRLNPFQFLIINHSSI
jgi:hypothetical protein